MALIDYEQTPVRLRPPQPGGLNDPTALAQGLRGMVSSFNRAPTAAEYGAVPQNQLAAMGAGPMPSTDQAAVRRVDNSLAAQGAPIMAPVTPSGAVPTPPPVTTPPVVAPAAGAAPANGGRPFALGSPQDTAFQSANLRANGGAQGPGPSMSVIDGGQDARQSFFDNANLRTAAARTNFSPRKGYTSDAGAIQAAAMPIQNRQRLAELSLKNAGDQSIAAMRDTTDRRGQDIAAATAAGAQDVTLRGQDVSAKTAAATARVDQMNKDRQFGLDVQKFGQDVAAKNFDVRQKAVKDVTDQVAGMLPPGPDGKPDTAGAARYASALNAQVAQRQEQLRAQLAKTPDRADVKAELEALDSRGLAAMDQSAIRKFIVGQQTAELAAQTGTSRYNPIGTSAANSTAPITSLREQKGLFGSDYISDRGDVIPARYLRENGQFNQDLNTLIQR